MVCYNKNPGEILGGEGSRLISAFDEKNWLIYYSVLDGPHILVPEGYLCVRNFGLTVNAKVSIGMSNSRLVDLSKLVDAIISTAPTFPTEVIGYTR